MIMWRPLEGAAKGRLRSKTFKAVSLLYVLCFNVRILEDDGNESFHPCRSIMSDHLLSVKKW